MARALGSPNSHSCVPTLAFPPGARVPATPAVPFPWPFSSRAQHSPPSSSLAWRCDPAAGDGLVAGDRRHRVGRRGGVGRRQPRALQARTRPAQGVPFLSRPSHYFRVSKPNQAIPSSLHPLAVPAEAASIRRNGQIESWFLRCLNCVFAVFSGACRYVAVYFSILYTRYCAGVVTREKLALPKRRFVAIGLLFNYQCRDLIQICNGVY
jgi:hypothetical protein